MTIKLGTIADNSFYFPMGEYHYRHEDENPYVQILYQFPSDIMQLLITVDAIRSKVGAAEVDLVCPYFPYARQDRITNTGEPFSCRVFASLINSQVFNRVIVVDPHSDVTAALVNRIEIIPQEHIARRAVNDFEPTCLAAPDAGAAKKVQKLSELTGVPMLQCGKNRDTTTGKLSGFWVHDEGQDLTRVLVVDDICDGGGTFIGLAEQLFGARAEALGLYVTHGGFTNGLRVLSRHFSSIYTTDTLRQSKELRQQVTVFNIVEETLV